MKAIGWIFIIAAAYLVIADNSLAGTYSGGSGAAEDPYQIADSDDLLELGATTDDYDEHFIMTADIDLCGHVFGVAVIAADEDKITTGFNGNAFTGVFDGMDYRVLNLTIDTAGIDKDYLGLFGQINDGGQVKNLGMENASITTDTSSYYIGGLCGRNYGTISCCWLNINVSGNSHVGGLCGFNDGTIDRCYVTGSISGSGADPWRLGGMCGANGGSISDCYTTTSITGGSYSGYLGGLCGWSNGAISNCYATGTIAGENSQHLGGLCGNNNGGLITSCFWDIETSGQTWSDGGTGLTTTNMKMQITFSNSHWDFINIWNIGENQTYPYLRKFSAADINKDHIVNLFDLAILCEQWMDGADSTPGITYKVGDCDMEIDSPPDNELRFSVKVDGDYIDFKDLINANCCIEDGISLEMLIEGNLITITETELSEGLCDCICNYPTTARLGPFEPGTYTVQVNQVNHSGHVQSIGSIQVSVSGS